ncbi:MAG: metalloregulator ArsR/SmtB family transcription factor [Phycisphaerae bacterium]|nr:metalloregulator ArsR/SmtB family transcription factor [Phycisphaerae bacterium]
MLEVLNITKALSDENRVRALMMLAGGELCVCQIIEMLGLAPSTVSKHMSILRQAGLVETRKESRWIYYRLADRNVPKACEILNWLQKHLKNDKKILDDAKQLRKMQKMSKDELCECYRSGKGKI